jgi:hypothetical protein
MKTQQAKQVVTQNASSLARGLFQQAIDAQGMGTHGAWEEPDDDLADAMIALGPMDLAATAAASMAQFLQTSAGQDLMQEYLQGTYEDVQQSFLAFSGARSVRRQPAEVNYEHVKPIIRSRRSSRTRGLGTI